IIRTVDVPKVGLNASLENAPLMACNGATIRARILTAYSPTNYTGALSLTYVWFKKSGAAWQQQSWSGSQQNLPAGEYKVTVKDATTLCSTDVVFTITELPALSADLQVQQPSCPGGSAIAQVVAMGGSGSYSYSWTNVTVNADNPIRTVNSTANSVTVVVKDVVGGCVITTQAAVAPLSAVPIKLLSVQLVANCQMIVQVSGGLAPYTFEWRQMRDIIVYTPDPNHGGIMVPHIQPQSVFIHSHAGTATASTTTTPFENGKYQVIITDANGCSVTGEYQFSFPALANFPTFSFVWSKPKQDPVPAATVDYILKDNMAEAKNEMFDAFDRCATRQAADLDTMMRFNCLNPARLKDKLTLRYTQTEGHYTLYYYDRAGQLTKTVPPEGVEILPDANVTALKTFRETAAPLTGALVYRPNHRMTTKFHYNSLGQLEYQDTPDGGITKFIYDDKSRLRFSQNAQQALDATFSYSKYDDLGRIVEVGKSTVAGSTLDFANLLNTANATKANDLTFPTNNRS
ncbi:MAG: hypothetical protein ABIQ93_10025, partial [Saprospiraceae bacterium]